MQGKWGREGACGDDALRCAACLPDTIGLFFKKKLKNSKFQFKWVEDGDSAETGHLWAKYRMVLSERPQTQHSHLVQGVKENVHMEESIRCKIHWKLFKIGKLESWIPQDTEIKHAGMDLKVPQG